MVRVWTKNGRRRVSIDKAEAKVPHGDSDLGTAVRFRAESARFDLNVSYLAATGAP